MSEFTQILEQVERGDPQAAAKLLPLVYDELRRLAAQKMSSEAAGHTLQPTALVHEAWLRLGGEDAPAFQNRAHFFGAAAEAMRRILIEHARRRLAAKRGSGIEPLDADEMKISSPMADDDQLLAVNEALEKFAGVGREQRGRRAGKSGHAATVKKLNIKGSLHLSPNCHTGDLDRREQVLFDDRQVIA